jgi:hypothetical protein
MRSERGSAVTESILLSVILLVPIIWLLSTLASVHAAALAASAAARDGSTMAAQAPDSSTALLTARHAAMDAFSAHGLDPTKVDLQLELPPDMARSRPVRVEITYRVPAFELPFFGEIVGPSIPIHASHISRIEPYASRP